MVSFQSWAVRKGIRAVLAVAAATLGFAGSSQPPTESAEATLQQLVETIEREQQHNGPLSSNLVGPLTALSAFYQESGDHALATATIQRALHVVRANHGLRAFDQAPLIRSFIRNEEARGNVAHAWSLEQDLLAVIKGHPDDLRAVALLREIGDRRMMLLERYLAGEAPPEISLGCYYQLPQAGDSSCSAGTSHAVVRGILTDAWSSYLDAISIFLRHELYSSDELRELETEILGSSYLYGNYGLGNASLRRLWGYEVAHSAPQPTQLEALVRLADWDLLFGRFVPAHERYLHVYELLQQEGPAERASIERLFPSEQPIALPTFLPNPLASGAEGTGGFIDVAFDVTWHGTPKQVEILATTTDATDEAKKRLVHLLSLTRFRPMIVDGEIARRSRVVLRYYSSGQRDSLDSPSDEVRRRNLRRYRADMGLARHFVEQLPSAHPPR